MKVKRNVFKVSLPQTLIFQPDNRAFNWRRASISVTEILTLSLNVANIQLGMSFVITGERNFVHGNCLSVFPGREITQNRSSEHVSKAILQISKAIQFVIFFA
jgi:hypothetical protein